MCVPSAVTSRLPSPCLPEDLPALLPSPGPCRGHGWEDAQAPPAPWESCLWLCSLHQHCFLKHFWPMWTLPAWAAPCPEGLEPVRAIFLGHEVCQPHALPCSSGSIPRLAPRAPRPRVPATAQVPCSQSRRLPACLALLRDLGPRGCRESRTLVPLPQAARALGDRAWGQWLSPGMPPWPCQLGHAWHGPGSGQSGLT